MLHVTPRQSRGRAPWLVRRRIQLLGALLLAPGLPVLIREIVAPSTISDVATWNAYCANLLGVLLSFWLRLTLEPYPGIRSSYVIFPTAAAAHGVVLALFFFARLPYDRFGFLLGFLINVLWFYGLYFLIQRRMRLRIGVIPHGDIQRLEGIDSVNWVAMPRPDLDLLVRCDAIVADFSDLPPEWEAFLADAALAGKIVYQVKPLHESLTGRVEIDHLSENSFGSLVPARGYFHLKTLLDWLLAVAVLPLLVPLMLTAAIAIRAEGDGPILFRQIRVGYRGRGFAAFKFRTMRVESHHPDARVAAMTGEKDPRITRVGAFLRRTRIDELPQIFNILRGEMSWIGPRPEAEVLSHWYAAELPFYRYRHVVKPGISGWAQVNQGHVADVEQVNRKLQYDFYYIKYFSPWLDLLIVFKTAKTIISGFGAR